MVKFWRRCAKYRIADIERMFYDQSSYSLERLEEYIDERGSHDLDFLRDEASLIGMQLAELVELGKEYNSYFVFHRKEPNYDDATQRFAFLLRLMDKDLNRLKDRVWREQDTDAEAA